MAQSVHQAGYELEDREIVFRFQAIIRSFLLQIAHSGFTQPSTNLMRTGLSQALK